MPIMNSPVRKAIKRLTALTNLENRIKLTDHELVQTAARFKAYRDTTDLPAKKDINAYKTYLKDQITILEDKKKTVHV